MLEAIPTVDAIKCPKQLKQQYRKQKLDGVLATDSWAHELLEPTLRDTMPPLS